MLPLFCTRAQGAEDVARAQAAVADDERRRRTSTHAGLQQSGADAVEPVLTHFAVCAKEEPTVQRRLRVERVLVVMLLLLLLLLLQVVVVVVVQRVAVDVNVSSVFITVAIAVITTATEAAETACAAIGTTELVPPTPPR